MVSFSTSEIGLFAFRNRHFCVAKPCFLQAQTACLAKRFGQYDFFVKFIRNF